MRKTWGLGDLRFRVLKGLDAGGIGLCTCPNLLVARFPLGLQWGRKRIDTAVGIVVYELGKHTCAW